MIEFILQAVLAIGVALLLLLVVIFLLGAGAVLAIELLARVGKWPRKGRY